MDLKKLGLFLTLILSFGICVSQIPSEELAYRSSIQYQLDNGEYKKAIKSLGLKIKIEPTDLWALSKRADLYIFLKKQKEAREDLNTLFTIDDQHCQGQLIYARLMQMVGESDSALFYIKEGLSYDTDLSTQEELYSLRGTVLMSMDRYEEAEENLFNAINNPEVSIGTMNNLATVLVENDKLDEAAMVLKEVIEIFGANLESYINTGYISNGLGMYDEAIFYLEEALKLEPENPYALSNASLAYLHTGQLDIAFKLVERSLKNDNSNSFAYRVKGECLMAMGEPQRSCREFKKAIQLGYTVLHEQTEITKLMIRACGTD